MKRLIPLLLCGACVGWSKTDTIAETSFAVATGLDWVQSATIGAECQEINPLVGQCGERLALYMPTAVLFHAAVSAVLPPGGWRRGWQMLTVGGEVATVAENWASGWGFMNVKTRP